MSTILAADGYRYCFDCWWCLFSPDPDERSDVHICYTDDCECDVCHPGRTPDVAPSPGGAGATSEAGAG